MKRIVLVAATGAALVAAAAGTAEARGHVSLSFGFPIGAPYYAPPPPVYYPPPAYYAPPPPPAYYAPPPAYYAPPPAVYTPPPAAYAPTEPSSETCREYQSPATIGGLPQNTHGIACLQPDGSWRIVQ